jgi:hypothetical protein
LVQEVVDDIPVSFQAYPLNLNSGWSVDGKYVAYFEITDQIGSLVILNDEGETHNQFTNKAYWLSPLDKLRFYWMRETILWSRNGGYILLYGVGTPEQPCPLPAGNDGSPKASNPCWQVLESSSGKIVWTTNDLLQMISGWTGDSDFPIYTQPAFSLDSEQIAVFYFFEPNNTLSYFSLATSELIKNVPVHLDFSKYQWGILIQSKDK